MSLTLLTDIEMRRSLYTDRQTDRARGREANTLDICGTFVVQISDRTTAYNFNAFLDENPLYSTLCLYCIRIVPTCHR